MTNGATLEQGMQELTAEELMDVSGGFPKIKEASVALGLAGTIGTAAFGGSWGAMAVGAAFGAAPLAVIGMAALGVYAGYIALK
jgi:hypothetical protein